LPRRLPSLQGGLQCSSAGATRMALGGLMAAAIAAFMLL
jgi:hypothetical protein